MKNIIAWILTIIITTFVVFAVAYWVFSLSLKESFTLGLIAAITGVIVELIKPHLKFLHK